MQKENDFFIRASEWCLYFLAFLLPFWFLPVTVAPVDFNKFLMVSVLVTLSFIFYLAHAILRGRIAVGFHWIFGLMGATGIFWLASAILSRSGSAVFWGIGAETNSFLAILIFLAMSWLIAMLVTDLKSFKKLFGFFILGLSVFILFIFASVLGIGKLAGGLLSDKTFNPIGSWNGVALAACFFVVMLYPLILGLRGSRRIFRWFLMVFFLLSVFVMVVVNFPLAWVILGFFSLILLSYAIWKRKITSAALLLTFFLLIVSILGFAFGDSFAKISSNVFKVQAPLEIGVSHSATFGVLKNALKEDFFFGKGPATFGYLWDLYKPTDVNQTVFWGVKFNVGSSYIFSLLGEIGILGWLVFVAFLLSVLYFGIKILSAAETDKQPFFMSVFFMAILSVVVFSLYPASYTLVAMGFFSIGLILALLRLNGNILVREIRLFGEGPSGFISAFLIVLLIIGALFALYRNGSKYAAEIYFSQGLSAFNNSGNIDLAEKKFISAASLDSGNYIYQQFLSQLYMARAQFLLQDKQTPKELLGSKFKDALDKAVGSAQNAINLAPLEANNYRALGKIYEFLTSLNAAGAADAAIFQYDAAIKHAPNNPLFDYDKASLYLSEAVAKKSGDFLKKAESELLKAVELKPDYADAHFLLAQIYDAEGNSSEAIKRGEAAALLSPNDIGTLFQLGLLYYKNERLADAEVVFNRTVSINSNYSNARYFLGLIYDRTKRKDAALEQFQKIASLNQDNDEIKKIISNIQSGRPALFKISPPLSPSTIKEVPVKDASEKSVLRAKKK